jgi:hypothetical protein
MKKIFLITFLLIYFSKNIVGQIDPGNGGIGSGSGYAGVPVPNYCVSSDANSPCCNNAAGHIKTFPALAYNPERPVNKFNWTLPTFKVYMPPLWGTEFPPTATTIINPFYTGIENEALAPINFFNFGTGQPHEPSKLDFRTTDGWELLSHHLGYQRDEDNFANTLDNRNNPYLMLYNRYTGRLRLIAAQGDFPGGSNTLGARIELAPSISGSTNYFSGVLNGGENGIYYALDQKTRVSAITQGGRPAAGRNFFHMDFQTSYDPCVCNTESDLRIKFTRALNANLQMEGRIIGVNTPLNTSGNIEENLTNRKDFLTSVSNPGFNVKGGSAIYHNIQSLVDRYKAPPDIDLGWFNGVFKNGVKSLISEGLNASLGGVNTFATQQSQSVLKWIARGVNNDFKTKINIDKIKGVDFDLAGALSKQLNTMIFPTAKEVPNISFLEAEAVFTGTMDANFNSNTDGILLSQPGSKLSNSPNTHWKTYPSYNEALGVFAVLRTPKADIVGSNHVTKEFPGEGGIGGARNTVHKIYIALPSQTVDFALNPAALIDESKTYIQAALVVKVNKDVDIFAGTGGLFTNSTNFHHQFQGVNGLAYIGETNTHWIFQSDFSPLNCLSKNISTAHLTFVYSSWRGRDSPFLPETPQDFIDKGVITTELKFMLKLTYLPDPNGKTLAGGLPEQKRGLQVYSYDARLAVNLMQNTNNYISSALNTNFIPSTLNFVKELEPVTYPNSSSQVHFWKYLDPENNMYLHTYPGNPNDYFIYIRTNNFIGLSAAPPQYYLPEFAPSQVPNKRYVFQSKEIEIVDGAEFLPGVELIAVSGNNDCENIPVKSMSPEKVKEFCRSKLFYQARQTYYKEALEEYSPDVETKKTLEANSKIYPNPAFYETNLSYNLPEDANVAIVLKDVSGVTQSEIQPNKMQNAGKYDIVIDTKNLASGLYFVVLNVNGMEITKKLIIQK